MFSRRNNFKEKIFSIQVDADKLDHQIIDMRNSLSHGSVRQACYQFGAKITVEGETAIITAERHKLQKLINVFAFSGVSYARVWL